MTMNTAELKRFAQQARRQLRAQVAARLEQVLGTDSAELRGRAAAIAQLKGQIAAASKPVVIDKVAYTWFNRFCALRFLDANRYQRIAVVSPAPGATQPEILQEAKGGYIEEELCRYLDRQQVFDLLAGRAPSADPQQEAYRLLLVAACNALHPAMPFLFEPIADYTELLMPLDLLSEGSVLEGLREALTDETCQDVEVIGWLYQFYIAERKDEVFAALKQNQKIEAEDIPAATQLFTPHWIVRYLVENSLGRLWLLNRPQSRLAARMDYYIQPVEPETDFLKVASPEEIKVCDPACGSGHMLTYAFDLLYAIYEEAGYNPTEIPQLILEQNLYGIEIDARAGALAAFALAMKARGKDKRFFQRNTQPQICVLENISFTEQELKEYMQVVGRDLFSAPLLTTLKQFEQAKNFGSLIRPALADPAFIIQELERKGLGTNLLLYEVHQRVLQVLHQAEFLAPSYHVVVANPPYMGNGNMNLDLKTFITTNYSTSKANLYASFIERNVDLTRQNGFISMISLESWMGRFVYEDFRKKMFLIINICSLVHLGAHAFDTIGGEVVSTAAFVLYKRGNLDSQGVFIRVTNGRNENEKEELLRVCASMGGKIKPPYYYAVRNSMFDQVPGKPIIYWASELLIESFKKFRPLSMIVETREGLTTGSNEKFLRCWHEASWDNVCTNAISEEDTESKKQRWYPIVKGGTYRKWFGNIEYIVDWESNGERIRRFADPETGRIRSHNYNGLFAFREGFTWTMISSGTFGVRHVPDGFMFDTSSPMGFSSQSLSLRLVEAFLNCKVSLVLMSALAPTLDFKLGNVLNLPFNDNIPSRIKEICECLVQISKNDWNSVETSWDFKELRLMTCRGAFSGNLEHEYKILKESYKKDIEKTRRLEEENNRFFIEAYGLQDELTPEVPLSEITLTCNPHYRYGGERSEGELEALLLADTLREFISYAVGCMFGRYSLDKPGLVLANQGETLADYLRQVPQPTFPPDADNAIPILDGEWFTDDITERFKSFLKVTFGAEHYAENLAFLEGALGRDIRSYFLREFYPHHLKMYKNRPIYWLFSSPKGAFNCLIYMHRYTPDTVSVVLSRYLRELITKLEVRQRNLEQVGIRSASSQREKTAALKEIEKLGKTLAELKSYEREVLYPLAAQRIAIDLDDGVKVNYAKFGNALAKVKGIG